MFDTDPALLAVRTAHGVDVFARHQDEGQSRARFVCLASLAPDGALTRHAGEDAGAIDAAALRALADEVAGAVEGGDGPLLQPIRLGDMTTWPRLAGSADPLKVFLYLDFFRAWQVADMAAARFERALSDTPDTALGDIGQLPAAVAPLFQFNMTHRATELARVLPPALRARLARGAIPRERADQAGYGLRMLGDLCLRARDPVQAHAVFALSCEMGDNPFRRQKAIEAALDADLPEAARAHARRYGAQWRLPAPLAERLAQVLGQGWEDAA